MKDLKIFFSSLFNQGGVDEMNGGFSFENDELMKPICSGAEQIIG